MGVLGHAVWAPSLRRLLSGISGKSPDTCEAAAEAGGT